MRGVVLVLLVNLIGPSVVGAVCDVTCPDARPTTTTDAGACHFAESAHDRTVVTDASSQCHIRGDAPAAIVGTSSRVLPAPAFVLVNAALTFGRSRPATAASPLQTVRPPGTQRITTLLRI